MTKDYQPPQGNFSLRLEARLKNDLLITARERLKLSAIEVARQTGVSYHSYIGYENMKSYPRLETIEIILEFFSNRGINLPAEVVFPDALKKFKSKGKVIAHREVPLSELAYNEALLLPSPHSTLAVDERINEEQVAAKIKQVIHTLSPRQESVISMRYGLDGNGPKTLDQIATVYRLSRERIRQIEKKAFERLKHTSARRKMLREVKNSVFYK